MYISITFDPSNGIHYCPAYSDLPSALEGLTIDIWSPPQDSGGMGTVFYTVYYQALISGSLRMTWGTVTTTSVTVTNLLPATEYRMTVVAQIGAPGDEESRSISIIVITQNEFSCTSDFYDFHYPACFYIMFMLLHWDIQSYTG